MAEVFKIIPTPDPNRVSIRVRVPTANIRADEFPKVGDRYDALAGADARRTTEGWGPFVYVAMAPGEDGFIDFIYAQNQTAEEKQCPKPYRSTPTREAGVNWPAVLEPLPGGGYLSFSSNVQYPFQMALAVNTAGFRYNSTPRVNVDYVLRQPWQGLTTVITDEYLSPTPWNEDQLATTSPDPQLIRFELIGNLDPDVREIGPCLHPEVSVSSTGNVTSFDDGGGDLKQYPPAISGKIFTATKMQKWQPHRVRASQEYIEGQGLYHITISTAMPPLTPSLTSSNI